MEYIDVFSDLKKLINKYQIQNNLDTNQIKRALSLLKEEYTNNEIRYKN